MPIEQEPAAKQRQSEPHEEEDHVQDHPMEGVSKEDDDDYTSSSGSSSPEPQNVQARQQHVADSPSASSDSDSEPDSSVDISTAPLRPSHAPAMLTSDTNAALRSRLDSFLPQMRAANVALEGAGDLEARRVDHVEEGEAYVEMNLGLGVLEQKKDTGVPGEVKLRPEDGGEGADDSEDSEVEADGEGDQDVLARLKGEKVVKTKRKIEELG